jgi:uncharacterized membrane protein YkoI
MRRPCFGFGAGTLVGLLLSLPPALAGEEAVPLDQVPKVVLDAVTARFGDASVKGASREEEHGKPVYEVTIDQSGRHIDVTVTPDGQIVLIETTIRTQDLPKAVTGALEQEYPGAEYRIVEEIVEVEKQKEELAYYEVLLLTPDAMAVEVQVTAKGKIVHTETKNADEVDD